MPSRSSFGHWLMSIKLDLIRLQVNSFPPLHADGVHHSTLKLGTEAVLQVVSCETRGVPAALQNHSLLLLFFFKKRDTYGLHI